jgi:hypothetical protein
MSKVDIRLQFRKIAHALSAQADVAGGTGHGPTTGSIREILARRFLRPHLPQSFEVRSGVIVDSEKRQSRQQDCVIVDSRLPLIDIGSETDAVFIAESVVATIEIKSFLGTSDLADALDSVTLTRNLVRKGQQTYEKGGAQITTAHAMPILAYIFAYDGLELDTISQHVLEFATSRGYSAVLPEAICVLSKGVLLRTPLMPVVKGTNITLPPMQQHERPTLDITPLKKDALFAFYRRLIDDVLPLRIINFDIDSYYS